ncbi:MAG: GNAT family N-acetyltransferase [Clostridia bacterium]|nr:GNAT family N-acetyltransferase [Clostridia bacterium]
MVIRHLEEADYEKIIGVLNDWWGGRQMADMLPRLFFKHFKETSFVYEDQGRIIAFLSGFVSQTYPTEAYIHFVGVNPDYRGKSLGRDMYERFFEAVKVRNCLTVHCVTSPVYKGSIAFHKKMEFVTVPGNLIVNGEHVFKDYDGPDQDRVVFIKHIT